MTVAVSCNLPEGVILGVDSAVTVNDATGGVLKTYENAQKLFQLGTKPIGIAIFGIGSIGARNIGSYIKEFEVQNPNDVVKGDSTVGQVAEALRAFFIEHYRKELIPLIEEANKKKFEEIPNEKKPILGLVVGGFSSHEYLSEVWQILVPINDKPNSAQLCQGKGSFGSNWFALFDPIFRYTKGYDRNLINELFGYIEKNILLNVPPTEQQKKEISGILAKYEYGVPFPAMPMDEGVAYVKFLVEMVVNHHRFAVGAPIVGGKARIGLVTYKGEKFQFIDGANNLGT